MKKEKAGLSAVDISAQLEDERKAYVSPTFKIIVVEDEGNFCASVTLDPQGSTQPNGWNTDQIVNGDHDEWFGSPSDVAPAKEHNEF